jgi:hypothetical protein
MAFNLKNRHLLSLVNHSEREIKYLLDLSRDLKRAKYAGTEQPKLQGKNIALIFEKTSTRTRCAFEVAAYDQGARGYEGHHPGAEQGDRPGFAQRRLARSDRGPRRRAFQVATHSLLMLNHHKGDLCGGFCLSAGDDEIWAGVVGDLGD